MISDKSWIVPVISIGFKLCLITTTITKKYTFHTPNLDPCFPVLRVKKKETEQAFFYKIFHFIL